MDALDDQLSLNSALPRTLRALLFHPGLLTREYVAGRIARYVAPFRLYLISSLLFFLTLTLTTDLKRLGDQLDVKPSRGAGASASQARDTPAAGGSRVTAPGAASAQVEAGTLSTDSADKFIRMDLDSASSPAWLRPLVPRLQQQVARLNGMSKADAVRTMVGGMERNAPKAIFLLLPVFALLLKLLYARRDRRYVEHFVFALHVHAFAFVLFTVLLSVRSSLLSSAVWIWFLVYLFLAMKHVYGQSYSKTAVKYVLLGWGYTSLLTIGMGLTALVTALTL